MKAFCENVLAELKACKNEEWAVIWVNRRMEFTRKFNMDLCFSTTHGADFFQNVLDCLAGTIWKEDGLYGKNFRELIKRNSSVGHMHLTVDGMWVSENDLGHSKAVDKYKNSDKVVAT